MWPRAHKTLFTKTGNGPIGPVGWNSPDPGERNVSHSNEDAQCLESSSQGEFILALTAIQCHIECLVVRGSSGTLHLYCLRPLPTGTFTGHRPGWFPAARLTSRRLQTGLQLDAHFPATCPHSGGESVHSGDHLAAPFPKSQRNRGRAGGGQNVNEEL